jgi:hypothetical protein
MTGARAARTRALTEQALSGSRWLFRLLGSTGRSWLHLVLSKMIQSRHLLSFCQEGRVAAEDARIAINVVCIEKALGDTFIGSRPSYRSEITGGRTPAQCELVRRPARGSSSKCERAGRW